MKNKTREALIITMEECGELTQACSKMIRSNGTAKCRKHLQDEIGDVMCMIEILKMGRLVTDRQIEDRMAVKRKKLEKWSSIFDQD